MQISINFRSEQPIYLQIVEQVQKMVSSGELKVGDQLPTVRQLATELRVNFNTVARAYRMLDEAGLISTQHGRGTYIWEQPDPASLLNLRQKSLEELTERFVAEAFNLGCQAEEIRQMLEKTISNWETRNSPPNESERK